MVIDYSGHSFSHLGFFYGEFYTLSGSLIYNQRFLEGLNGRLPNQDLMNSVNVISSHTGHVPVILYDKPDEVLRDSMRETVSGLFSSDDVLNYLVRAKRMLRHFSYQSVGRPSGIHGLFHPYFFLPLNFFPSFERNH